MSKTLEEGLSNFYAQQTEAGNAPAPGNRPWGRKIKSVALAVHPDQVPEAMEDAAKRGVPTDFTSDGRPILTDRNHRRRYMQAYGYFDRDAGYGDAAPKNHKGDKRPPNRLSELRKRLAERIRVRREAAMEEHRG